MKKILLSIVAVTAFATSASAIEAGKMYMKADVGYNMSSPKLGDKLASGKEDDAVFKSTKDNNRLKGFTGDIGFGYALSDSVRTDLTFNFSQGKKTLKDVELNKTIGTNADAVAHDGYSDKEGKNYVTAGAANSQLLKSKIKLKEKKIGLMASVYYDFHNASEFVPYVIAGVGVNRGTLEAKVDGYEAGTTGELKTTSATIKSKNLTSFAYQVGVGVGYEMSQDIFLDLGYKLSSSTGKYKFKTNSAGTATDPAIDAVTPKDNKMGSPKQFQHSILAGVRFAF